MALVQVTLTFFRNLFNTVHIKNPFRFWRNILLINILLIDNFIKCYQADFIMKVYYVSNNKPLDLTDYGSLTIL